MTPLCLSARRVFSGFVKIKTSALVNYSILRQGEVEDVFILMLSAESFIELHRLDSK